MRIALFLLAAVLAFAQPRNLEIYWIDVEGGAATLIVTPSGESLLADTGSRVPGDRDAKRIFEVAKLAGLTKIDYVLITHFHSDHVGGVGALANLIPVGRYLDHGDSIETSNPPDAALWKAYLEASQGKRTVLKPGDKLPLKGVESEVVIANGVPIAKPLAGGGANAFCKGAQNKPPDTTENQRSLGFVLTFGKFRFFDAGDLTWDKEMELACPTNKIGTVTLFQATHHGFNGGQSGAPAHVLALKPQVVVVNNGPRKGWDEQAWQTSTKIDGLEGIWQVHQALWDGSPHNTDPQMIANPEPTPQCNGNWIKATVRADGTFTVKNGRNGSEKSYKAR
jgi:beta-lactamase superfamily II metal-dependent hydrolase